ncbi:MAG TPA: fluoride efflux transporter CrcB [Pyrinomonadaceae bacterium]|nr:fluoride efflux transporter CrcB [Pyrinomonadaceae bacterium]
METLFRILSIAVGGAFGAVARHLLNISPLASIFQTFPFPTLFINVSGSFLIGFFLILFTDKIAVSDNLRLMILIGFLGGFTTFSTFEIEIFGLVRERNFITAFSYLFLSVFLGFVGVLGGVWLAKRF